MKAFYRITFCALCLATGVVLAWWLVLGPAERNSHSLAGHQPVDGAAASNESGDSTSAARESSQSAGNLATDASEPRPLPAARNLPWQSAAAPLQGNHAGAVAGNGVTQAGGQSSGATQAYQQPQGHDGQAMQSLLYVQPSNQQLANRDAGNQPPTTLGPPSYHASNDALVGLNGMSRPPEAAPYNRLIIRPVSSSRTAVARQDQQGQAAQRFPGEGDDKLEIYVNEQPITAVLALLAEQGGVNILPLPGLQTLEPVSFAMNGVTVDEALDGILRSTRLIARREGSFIMVGTAQDFDDYARAYDRIGTRIYRPDYISAADLQAMLSTLMTPEPIGRIQATAPAEQGIPSDAENAGGNTHSDTDALIVQDWESVLQRLDQIVLEVDRRPMQVAIEAMILSVAIDDDYDLGVDFQFLRDQGTVRFGLGTPDADLGTFDFENGGLRFAFLDSNLGAFVRALEEIGDTDVIATPRLTVLNKQRAEILIGAQLGYVNTTVTETAATQTVDFLEIGTQLRLRPFIARDGTIRLEVHPELSTGSVRIEGGFTLPDKEVTSVTTNIMVQDGGTIVIGGLMREDLVTTTRQVPWLGNLPWLGALFRSKSESTEKREIVLLVTPRIVHEPEICAEGEAVACEFHRRQAAYAQRMSPISRTALGRERLRMAQEAWARGDRGGALDLIHWALQFDPQNRAALDLQADILARNPHGNHTLPPASPHGHLPSPVPPHAKNHMRTEYFAPRSERETGPGFSPDMRPENSPGFPAPGGGSMPGNPGDAGFGTPGAAGGRAASRPGYR